MSIPINELEELFEDTLNRASSSVLKQSDEEIGYNIFEEFDISAYTFLHEDSLKRLLEAKIIDINIYELSSSLRNLVLKLQKEAKWKFELVKTDSDWKALFNLTDEIIRMKKDLTK